MRQQTSSTQGSRDRHQHIDFTIPIRPSGQGTSDAGPLSARPSQGGGLKPSDSDTLLRQALGSPGTPVPSQASASPAPTTNSPGTPGISPKERYPEAF